MSNLNNLVTIILDDAKRNVDQIIDEAKKEEQEIIDKKVEEANQQMNKIVEKAKIESENKRERIISNAKLQVRNQKLEAKQNIINKTFEKSLEELMNLSKEQYLDFVEKSILALPIDGDEVIIVKQEDSAKLSDEFISNINQKLIKQGIKGKLKLSDERRNISGGFILYKNGVEINNTYEALISSYRDELEYEVVKILFD